MVGEASVGIGGVLRPLARTEPGEGPTGWGFAIQESLVLLVPGVTLAAMGIYLLDSSSRLGPARWPIWEVLVALGGIALAGGVVSIFASDEELDDSVGGRPLPWILRAESVPFSPAPPRAASALPSRPRPARNVPVSPRAAAPLPPPTRRIRREPIRWETEDWEEDPAFDSPREALAEIDRVDALLKDSQRRLRSWD